MGKEYLSTIWPILYFKADWPLKSYNFDLGVQLIRVDETMLEDKTELGDNDCWNANEQGRLDFRFHTQWFLAMRRPQIHEHAPVNQKGISFVDILQKSTVESFLICLQLIRSTAAICPFEFRAEIDNDSIIDIDTTDDFCGINSDKPPVYLEEAFKIDDLQLLTDLWSAIIKLRKLYLLAELFNKEEFFAECDKEAGEDTAKKLNNFAHFIDALKSHPDYLAHSEEDRKQIDELISSSLPSWAECYRESFPEVFSKKQEEVFLNRTRIGRALNLFFEGIRLPLQHSFLSMCLVLETIFTVEDTEITYQFATRLANITGKTFEQRKGIFKKAREVYRERSNIVHGRKTIETVEPRVLKDAFLFARQSLQHILLDLTLLNLYSDPITSDKTTDPDKAIKAIKEYFRDLDLRRD